MKGGLKPGRNDPCPCGSGQRYKHCCGSLANVQAANLRATDMPFRGSLQAALKHHQAGHLPQAEAIYQQILKREPNHPDALHFLGVIANQSGNSVLAVELISKAIRVSPLDSMYLNLGTALKDQGKLDAAIENYHKALSITPDYAEAHYNLGIVLQRKGNFDAAIESYRKALLIKSDFAEVHGNLAEALQYLGRLEEAVASYRRMLEINPDDANAHSSLLFCLSRSEAVDTQPLFREHCRFAEQFEAPLRGHWLQHANSRDPKRPLRIGLVSGDLRDHSVANLIEPVLAHLSIDPQFSLHAYCNHGVEDAVTQRLRRHPIHWHAIVSLSDDALAQKIRADRIDILIDLSGHTANHRLLTFARKPAPVQASWIGYPGTTGLRSMDYYLSDSFLFPPGQFDDQFTEKIVRMPAVASFMPAEDAPSVNALPALSNGYVTLGSFNRANKISRSVIALWAQLLRAVPDSRMLLGGMPEGGKYDRLIEWFAQESISRDRLRFHVHSGMERYLGLHHQVDMCLDTFPYNGGTTTLHALWMGVPTLTLAGGTAAGRPGVTILGHVDLDAFVAHNREGFVRNGLFWAGNIAALSDIRKGLRERFAKSAISQPEVVAQGLKRALRVMWERWCAGLPAESFQVSVPDVCHMTHEPGK